MNYQFSMAISFAGRIAASAISLVTNSFLFVNAHSDPEPLSEVSMAGAAFHRFVSVPALGNDGTIFVTANPESGYGSVIALTHDLQTRWQFDTGLYGLSAPAVGTSGTVYVGAENGDLLAFSPGGTLKWRFRSGEAQRPENLIHRGTPLAVSGNETVHCGSRLSGTTYLVRNGTLARTNAGFGLFTEVVPATPIIGPDETVYVPIGLRGFVAQSSRDFEAKWSSDLALPSAIDHRGTLYCVGENQLTAVDFAGSYLWSRAISKASSRLAIGEDGTLYMSQDRDLLAITPSGRIIWTNSISGIIAPAAGNQLHVLSTFNVDHTGFVLSTIKSVALGPAGETVWSGVQVSDGTRWREVHSAMLSISGKSYYLTGNDRHSNLAAHLTPLLPSASSWSGPGATAQNTRRAEAPFRSLNVRATGPGTASRSTPDAILPLHARVMLVATPADGARFVRWSGDFDSTASEINVKMDTHKSIVAEFAAKAPLLSIARAQNRLVLKAAETAPEAKLQSSGDLASWQDLGPVGTNRIIEIEACARFYRLAE